MTRNTARFSALMVALCLGCSAPSSLRVGNELDGSVGGFGDPAGSGGLGGGGGHGGSSSHALTAHIENPQAMTIEVVTLQCAGDCADVIAVASGGNPSYAFAWNDGVTTAARTVCLDAGATFTVTATDTPIDSGEFRREAQTATASVTAAVIGCEPLPDGGVPCATGAGHYVGTFTCLLGGLPFTGPLDLTLTSTQSGMSLSVTAGRLNGSAFGLVPFSADIVGTLDCGTGELEARLENGQTPAEAFGGTMHAVYDPIGPALNGTWELSSLTNSATRCDGTWTAALEP